MEEYIATWPEDQRHLFYEDPQGLYTFPLELSAMNAVGYGNSANPENPVKYSKDGRIIIEDMDLTAEWEFQFIGEI